MQRISQANLDTLCEALNTIAGTPLTYRDPVTGKTAIGHYHMDYAYGGCKLVQTVTDGGGIRSITTGYETKRKTYELMHAYMSGMRAKEGR